MEALMKTHLLISKSYDFFFSCVMLHEGLGWLEIWGLRRESGWPFFLEPIQYIYWKTKQIIMNLTDSERRLSLMWRCLCWMCIQSLLPGCSFSVHGDTCKLQGLATCSHLKLLISIWQQWSQFESTYILHVDLALCFPWPSKTFDSSS